MKFRNFWLYTLCLISMTASAQENPWSIGLQTGYNALGSVRAVPVKNGVPLGATLRYQLSDLWNAKFEYQWIKSEHTDAQSANFQTFRTSGGYRFLTIDRHAFNAEAGVGYQYTSLRGIDQIRQMELSAGPTWAWNAFQQWNLEGAIKYARSFDRLISSNFQRFEITLGISFKFGDQPKFYSSKSKATKTYVDADQDGIPDHLDQCSATPFGMKVSKNGCALDGDGDLIVDYNDYCPNTKRGVEVDDMGCPLHITGRGVIDGVAFEYNSPRLTASSKNELEKVALNLKNYPDVYFIIEGYSSTDKSSYERMNISTARAMTVMNILASYGIPSSRMKAVGLSDQYPLTDSKDRADQILNERIEIKWKHQL